MVVISTTELVRATRGHYGKAALNRARTRSLDERDVEVEIRGDFAGTLALAKRGQNLRQGDSGPFKNRGAPELVRIPFDAVAQVAGHQTSLALADRSPARRYTALGGARQSAADGGRGRGDSSLHRAWEPERKRRLDGPGRGGARLGINASSVDVPGARQANETRCPAVDIPLYAPDPCFLF
jgi:hypothetical protein